MTQTTTTIGKTQKLQPKPLDNVTLRQLLGSWKRAGLSYAQIFKMQKLYLGETGWMDQKGEYPRNNFYEVARGLKFDSVSELIACIKRCKGFGLVWMCKQHDRIDNLLGLFSELWYKWFVLAILTGPSEVRNNSNNIAGRSTLCCVDHQEQLHQVV